MSAISHLLGRPRSLFLFVGLVFILTFILYASPIYSSSSAAKGYIPPSPVLPSYISSSSIPYCLPEHVRDHVVSSKVKGYGAGEPESDEDMVSVKVITDYMQQHITDKQRDFDPQADDDYLGLKIGDSWDLPSYRAELLETYREYLSVPHIPNPSFMPPLESRLSLRPPIAPLPPRPNQVLTTDKTKDLPFEFGRWKELHPDWEIRFFDDDALDEWVHTMFGGTRAQKVWNMLPRAVLKADIFR